MKSLRLTFIESSLQMDLDIYKKHTIKVELFLAKEVKEFETYTKKLTDKWDDYKKAEYYEDSGEEHWQLSKVFPSIQRNSELISIYSIFENNISRICKLYESEIDNPIKLSDLESNGYIDQAQKYLEKVVRIKFPNTHSSWTEILKIQQIRNSFVHANGYIKTGNSNLISYIRQSQYLEINDKYKVQINKGFSTHCLNLFSEFFTELFKNMNEQK